MFPSTLARVLCDIDSPARDADDDVPALVTQEVLQRIERSLDEATAPNSKLRFAFDTPRPSQAKAAREIRHAQADVVVIDEQDDDDDDDDE